MGKIVGKKLKKKIRLGEKRKKEVINHRPCKDFHLKIFQTKEDPKIVNFIYIPPEKYRNIIQELHNEAEVKKFFEILSSTKQELPCERDLFIFKTIYSNLNEAELEILRGSRKKFLQDNPEPTKNMNKYLTQLEGFLKNKMLYERKMKKQKKIIKEKYPDITNKRRRELLQQNKPRCIGCKKRVGNNFIFEDGNFKITCGSNTPCKKITFELKKQKVIYIPRKRDKLIKLLEETKQQIIKVKLDLLFQLKDEDSVTEEFQVLKAKYNEVNAEIFSLEMRLDEQQKTDYRKENIALENIKLIEMIKLYKLNIKEYESSNEHACLKEAINTYIKDITHLQENIRNLSYSSMFVEPLKFWNEVGKGEVGGRLIQYRNLIENKELLIK